MSEDPNGERLYNEDGFGCGSTTLLALALALLLGTWLVIA